MTNRSAVGRRAVLRGFGGAVVALPFLEAMEAMALRRQARAAGPMATRLVCYFVPIGMVPERWWPTGSGEKFTIASDSCLAPLEPHKKDIIVLKGVDMQSAGRTNNTHGAGISNVLTGNGAAWNSFSGFAKGPSIDQVLAQRIGRGTKFPSLELGIMVQDLGSSRSTMSYTGPDRPRFPEIDPVKVFDRIFRDLSASGTGADTSGATRRALRHSVLDGVKASLMALSPRLGSDDRMKVEEHLEGIRQLEKQIDIVAPTEAECGSQRRPANVPPFNQRSSLPIIGDLQEKLLLLALKCGQTRVAGLQWQNGSAYYSPALSGVGTWHHGHSHKMGSDPVARDWMVKISRWYTERFARFVGLLKATPDGVGKTLLDSTLVLHVSEVSIGNSHKNIDMPFILAGGGGYFRTGRYVTYNSMPHNNLLVSVMNAMGQPDTTFGNKLFCTGPLAGLKA
jgi:hypothetical protein